MHMSIRTPRRFALVVLAALVAGAAVEIDAQRAAFKSGVDMVPLTVTVTDGRGQYVSNLAGTDFTVFEDGVQQQLSFFASEQVALDLALVLDVSGSMNVNMPLVKKAARGLVASLRPGDRATIAAVRNAVGIPQGLTTDHALVEAAIQGLTASGDTALYDGLYVVLKELARARVGTTEIRKQTLVVLSDGLDTASRLSFDDVKDLAGRVGVNIYVIAIPASTRPTKRNLLSGRFLQAEFAMKSLARESGGRSFFPQTVHELPNVYSEIGNELANQYELGYLPQRVVTDRGFRRVSVQVTNAVARTRTGYYADAGRIAASSIMNASVPATAEAPQR